MTEALRVLENWDDAFRSCSPNSRWLIDKGVATPLARLCRKVHFYRDDNANTEAYALATSPHTRDLRQIVVTRSCCDLLSPFAASTTTVRALRVVEVHDSPIGDEGWNLLPSAPAFASVERLSLSNIMVPARELARVLDGTPGRALRDLELRSVSYAGELVREVLLPRKTIVKQLTSLAVNSCFLRDADAETFARASDLRGLHTLDLRGNEISARGRKAILDAPQFRSTRVLFD